MDSKFKATDFHGMIRAVCQTTHRIGLTSTEQAVWSTILERTLWWYKFQNAISWEDFFNDATLDKQLLGLGNVSQTQFYAARRQLCMRRLIKTTPTQANNRTAWYTINVPFILGLRINLMLESSEEDKQSSAYLTKLRSLQKNILDHFLYEHYFTEEEMTVPTCEEIMAMRHTKKEEPKKKLAVVQKKPFKEETLYAFIATTCDSLGVRKPMNPAVFTNKKDFYSLMGSLKSLNKKIPDRERMEQFIVALAENWSLMFRTLARGKRTHERGHLVLVEYGFITNYFDYELVNVHFNDVLNFLKEEGLVKWAEDSGLGGVK